MLAFTQRSLPHLRPRRLAGPLLLAAAIFYLCFHALSGERGLYALFRESHRLEQLKAERETLAKQRAEMEHKVRLLSSSSLDLDLLEEQARLTLGLTGKDEVMVITK